MNRDLLKGVLVGSVIASVVSAGVAAWAEFHTDIAYIDKAVIATSLQLPASVFGAFIAPANLTATANTRTFAAPFAALSAGVSQAATATGMYLPFAYHVTAARLVPGTAGAATDAANTITFTLTDATASATIVAKAYSASPAYPAANTPADFGTITTAAVAADHVVTIAIAQGGATHNITVGAGNIEISFTPD